MMKTTCSKDMFFFKNAESIRGFFSVHLVFFGIPCSTGFQCYLLSLALSLLCDPGPCIASFSLVFATFCIFHVLFWNWNQGFCVFEMSLKKPASGVFRCNLFSKRVQFFISASSGVCCHLLCFGSCVGVVLKIYSQHLAHRKSPCSTSDKINTQNSLS